MCCASGVRCEFKNASNIRTNLSSAYGPVTVADALAVSSDAFFYRLGEKFWEIDEHNAFVDPSAEGQVDAEGRPGAVRVRHRHRRAAAVRVAGPNSRRCRSRSSWSTDDVLGKNEVPSSAGRRQRAGRDRPGPDGGDAVAAGQRVLDARQRRLPLPADRRQDDLRSVGARSQPGCGRPRRKGMVFKSFDTPTYKDQLEMPPEIRDPIVNGLARVTNAVHVRNPGVTYPSSFYHTTTGETLFQSYPMNVLPIAGKTGTAQGASSYPWNDSSAFARVQPRQRPALHGRRLPREERLRRQGRGAGREVHVHRARRPDADGARCCPATRSTSTRCSPAPPTQLADSSCMPAAVDARD